MSAQRHAEIAGAGFAGLTAGVALAQRGWSVRIHEASRELRAFGAGIFIWENGLRVLAALGAYREVIAGAHEAISYETRHDGRLIAEYRFTPEKGTRMLTMTRQHLYAALLRAAQRDGIDIVVGSEVTGATPAGSLITADGRQFQADLVIGADGVRSWTRQAIDIDVQTTPTGMGIWRVFTERPESVTR